MRRIVVLSVGNFFSAAHFFLIVYILAPYLATLMPDEVSGLAISLGAVITLTGFTFLPKLVRAHGPKSLGIFFGALEMLLLLGLAFEPHPVLAVLLAAAACATSPFIAYQLDLLLEAAITDERSTGRIRAAFLTTANIALVLAPIITGLLLDESEAYGRVFFVAALTLLPFMFVLSRGSFPHPRPPERTNMREACMTLMRDRDLRSIALSAAVLQVFFHLAPLYIPLYLHNELGIPWSDLGWMFSLMLVPFVVLEYPAGWLADTKVGDRRILATGFVIMCLAFIAMGFVSVGTSLAAIATVLVLSRTGSALVEAMVEGHFFRRVTSDDADIVGVFRMLRPIGALLAPVIGSVLLTVSDYTTFFAVSGFLMLAVGLWSVRGVEDLRLGERTDCPPFGSCLPGRA